MSQDYKDAAAHNLIKFVEFIEYGMRKYHVVNPHKQKIIDAIADMKTEAQVLRTLQEITVPTPNVPTKEQEEAYGDVGDEYKEE